MLMKSFNKWSSLQQKLTFYPLFWFAIGLIITFFISVYMIKLYLDNYLMAQVTAYSEQTAKDITSIIDRDKETITAFLLSDTFKDFSNDSRITVALERLLGQNKNFLEGYVIDLNGKTLISVSRLKIFTNQQPDFHRQTIFAVAKSGKIGISGWENFIEKNRPYYYMAIPIERYPGNVTGVLIVTIDLRRIEDTILISQGAKYGTPVLLDHTGNVLVHIDQSKLGDNWSRLQIVQKVLRGEIGASNFYDEQGRYFLAAYQPLNPYNWGLIVQVPPGQTIYIIRDKFILLFSLMMIIIFIVTGLLTYIAAGKIVIPIKELTQASQKFGQGEKLEYSPVNGEDELAHLSTTFCEMATALQDHEKRRAQYISMIAHELRNPLTSITGFFQALQGDAKTSDIKLHHLNLNKLEQVNRMIGDLLEFSRLDLGQVNFSPEVVSVKYLFEDIISSYREKSPKFMLRPFSEQICVWADPLRLQQILHNILDNSLKYTPAESPVTIDCTSYIDWVEISISDSGPGIPGEVLTKLFKPFEPNSFQKSGSYGLGLAISKKLALKMNGDLIIKSVENQGSTFIVIIPKPNSN